MGMKILRLGRLLIFVDSCKINFPNGRLTISTGNITFRPHSTFLCEQTLHHEALCVTLQHERTEID
jgi:hypothetical protein